MGRELDYVTTAVQTGSVGGAGGFAAKCQAVLEKELGVKKVLLTTSCTAALEMAALLIDAQPGDDWLPGHAKLSRNEKYQLRRRRRPFDQRRTIDRTCGNDPRKRD